jgi:hypothetical protein
MLNSEKDWLLTVNLNDVVADYVKPERKSVASLFNVGASEVVSFYGTKQMSPFNFDSFKLTITDLNDADSIKCGISIMFVIFIYSLYFSLKFYIFIVKNR